MHRQGEKKGNHLKTKQLAKLQRQEWIDHILGKATLSIQGQIRDPNLDKMYTVPKLSTSREEIEVEMIT